MECPLKTGGRLYTNLTCHRPLSNNGRPADQRCPTGAKTDELRRRNLGRGLLISIVTALLAWDVNYAPTQLPPRLSSKSFNVRFLLKIIFICSRVFCNLNFAHFYQQPRPQLRQIHKVRRVWCHILLRCSVTQLFGSISLQLTFWAAL